MSADKKSTDDEQTKKETDAACDAQKLERYKIAVSMMHEQARLVWQVFAVFVAAHAIVLSQLLRHALLGTATSLASVVGAALGLVGCIAWSAIFERGFGYFLLRCEQVRESEPHNYRLFRDHGERFAKGEEVRVDCARPPLVLRGIARSWKTRNAANFTIWVFGIGYGVLLLGACFAGLRSLLCHCACGSSA